MTVNGKAAPIYFVSAGQINFLVPYATTGSTATIVVQNNGVNSNTVTVPLAATAPGVYTMDQSGSGFAVVTITSVEGTAICGRGGSRRAVSPAETRPVSAPARRFAGR